MKYDFVYLCGYKRSKLDPRNTDDLGGGSEKAVVFLSEAFAKLGSSVLVIGNVFEGTHNGVQYVVPPLESLLPPVEIECGTLIIWRDFGLKYFHSSPIKFLADKTCLDLHDFYILDDLVGMHPEIEDIFVKSQHHLDFHKQKGWGRKFHVVQNGLYVPPLDPSIRREPHRFVYASSLDRGVVEVLEDVWPKVVQMIPDGEFHIYYGRLNFIADEELLNKFTRLKSQKGVFFHDRVSQGEIYREYMRSSYYLYIMNNEFHEADCLSIREAYSLGCIPIINNIGVFKERDGVHVDGVDSIDSVIKFISEGGKFRTTPGHSENLSWSDVAEMWSRILGEN
jgi:hypothetical protein